MQSIVVSINKEKPSKVIVTLFLCADGQHSGFLRLHADVSSFIVLLNVFWRNCLLKKQQLRITLKTASAAIVLVLMI